MNNNTVFFEVEKRDRIFPYKFSHTPLIKKGNSSLPRKIIRSFSGVFSVSTVSLIKKILSFVSPSSAYFMQQKKIRVNRINKFGDKRKGFPSLFLVYDLLILFFCCKIFNKNLFERLLFFLLSLFLISIGLGVMFCYG